MSQLPQDPETAREDARPAGELEKTPAQAPQADAAPETASEPAPEVASASETPTAQKPEAPADAGESTIFSAPVHTGQEKVRRPHRVRNALITLLVLAILAGGTVAVIRLIPVPDDEETAVSTQTIKAVNYSSDDLAGVTVTNASGKLHFISKESTSSDSSTTTVEWSLEGVESDLTSESVINSTVSAAANMTALREMTDRTVDYGFASPRMTVAVEGRKVDSYTLQIGSAAPDESGAYVRVEGQEAVYLVEQSTIDRFARTQVDYASESAFQAVEQNDANASYFGDDGALLRCDSITMTNRATDVPYVFVPNDEDAKVASMVSYLVQSPVRRLADNIDDLLTYASGETLCDGVYQFYPTEADLKKYGFDRPIASLRIRVGNVTREVLVAPAPAAADGTADTENYAVVDENRRAIYRITRSTLTFVDAPLSRYFNKFLSMEMLNDLRAFVAQTPDRTYTFQIAYNDEANAGEDFDIQIDGKKLDQANFQDFYQYFVGLEAVSYETRPVAQLPAPAMTVRLQHVDKSVADIVLVFRESPGDQRCQVEVDGSQLGMISAQSFSRLQSYLQKVAANQDVPTS